MIKRLSAAVLLLTAASGCSTVPPSDTAPSPALPTGTSPFARLEFVAALEPFSSLESSTVGGLSGIAWDPDDRTLLAISDNRGDHGPVGWYEFALQLPVREQPGHWEVLRQVPLLDRTGTPLAPEVTDLESIALLGTDLVISSEGTSEGPPFVSLFDRSGRLLKDVKLPDYLFPGDGQGVRSNLGTEAVATLPSGVVFAGMENALIQDGPEADIETPSPTRLLRWDARGQRSEFVYWTDPVVDFPESPDQFRANGLVALLALDQRRLLALERSYTVGFANDIRLYLVDLTTATDVSGEESLPEDARAAEKRLLARLSDLNFNLDNIEGMTWGPDFADGRRSLLMVSDDNFSAEQTTHLLVFAVSDEVAEIPEIQGPGHRSVHDGAWLYGVEGTVTQVRQSEEGPSTGWIQSGDDGDLRTSSGLRVIYDAGKVDLRPGHSIRADGRLVEVGRWGQLSVTTLQLQRAEDLGAGDVPAPVRLDPQGVDGPGIRPFSSLPLDDDGMAGFNPSASTMDLLESLEGVRIQLPAATAVSGTSTFGEIALLPDGAEGLRSPTGGVLLTPESFNPQRLIAIGGPEQPSPQVRVGDRFDQPISGVLDYSFGNYKLMVDAWPQVTRPQRATPTVPWQAAHSDFTFATYNVLNLDPGDAQSPTGNQFDRLAESIVTGLHAPDVLALQEIQDNNGPEDEGVTSADRTLTMLIDAISAAGGPDYGYVQIDPIHDGEGGQPVGNIRVAFLYRSDRVQLDRRGAGDTWTSTEVTGAGDFSLSPGRVAVNHPAFAGDERRTWEPNRRCLAATFSMITDSAQEGTTPAEQGTDRQWSFINCHLKSKRGDDRLFGDNQPPVFHTEVQRSAQTEVLASIAGRILEAKPDARLVVLGDTNEHEFRRPLRILAASGLTNLVEAVPQADRYTYNFNGNSQILDNVLVSPEIMACQTEVAIVHWNTDLSDAERASDHDPVAVKVGGCN